MAGKCSYLIVRICTDCPHPDFHPSNEAFVHGLSLPLGNPRIGVHFFDVLPWWQSHDRPRTSATFSSAKRG